jgi:enterochelin esterase-like enzyme
MTNIKLTGMNTRKTITGFLIFVLYTTSWAQPHSLSDELSSIVQHPGNLDSIWNTWIEKGRIPLTLNDSVIFLYRGEANSVQWMGDFNGWGRDASFANKGKKIPNTDIWILKSSFPNDARLDYKILVNDKEWIIDPANPHQQWSGVGGGSPNSELRMPEWRPDPVTVLRENIPRGRLEKDLLIDSKTLGYQLTYSVYYPQGYDKTKAYPVLYVTDGYEYLHERLGNMQVILDNLIADKKMEPILAVFIDHREPVNRSNNRRMDELAMNTKYLAFFTGEFVPFIESRLNVSQQATQRGILGTSMGGLTAAYFAFSKPELFGLAGVQSPAFWFKPEIYTLCDQADSPPVKIFMTSGSIHDTREGAVKMKSILEKNTCTFEYKETNQGHSWGNFRDSIDDILVYFFPAG